MRRVARFAAIVVALALATTGTLGADTDTAVPVGRGSGAVDRLGDARLFFPASERGAGDGSSSGSSSRGAGDGVDDRRGAGDATASGPASPRDGDAGGGAGAGGLAAGRAPTRPAHPRFQAVLRVGDRVRVVVGDRPCHDGGATANALRCDALPGGIRSLALDIDGRRLIATFADGRRERFAVGAVIRP